jgi:hypothetical protein
LPEKVRDAALAAVFGGDLVVEMGDMHCSAGF